MCQKCLIKSEEIQTHERELEAMDIYRLGNRPSQTPSTPAIPPAMWLSSL